MPVLNYLSKFEAVFEALNQQQKNAVQHIEGPVMVIAGPGTGKTQILAARIARILLETDALPENILCLTYTDAGAIAMRKRLQDFIGPDAYRVQLSTFHGFCNKVIQENLDVFGFRNLDPISDLENIQLLRELVDDLPKSHPLKRYTGDVYYEIYRLSGLFGLMKKEDWSTEYLQEKIAAYCKELPFKEEYLYKRAGKSKDGKSYVKGDVKQDAINAELAKMNLLKAAVDLFEPFQNILQKNNRYDFSDMILWVIKAFKEDNTLLSDYQEKYQFVLVDEFQDTSGSQNDLLELLLNYWDIPNVFAVGDDDQSIYRFQGANIENIQNFIDKYASHMKMVTLEDNYRSTQHILDASKKLISKNTQRISEDKILIAKNKERADLPFLPKVVSYFNPIHESVAITKEIEELNAQGVPLNEIAILYRNHRQAEEMIAYLKSKNIEVNTRKRVNILQEPFIKKIIKVMQFLSAETDRVFSGENHLFEILHFKEFSIPTLEIARLSVEIANKNFLDRQTSWREELSKLAIKKQADLFQQHTHGYSLQKFSQTMEGLIKVCLNQTPQETIHQILRDCGFLADALTQDDKMWHMEMLQTFFNFVKAETTKSPIHTLKSITALMELMMENSIQLGADKVSYSETGVNFMTTHSSKGLEFDYVYIIGCTSKIWDEGNRNRNYKLPDNLFTILGDEIEETRRLFYVAMTRAKLQLQMSFYEQDLQQKSQEPSRFIAEITEDHQIPITRNSATDEELLNFLVDPIISQGRPILPKPLIDNAFIDSLLDRYTLSVTHLNGFLKCPISFYFNNFIKVPSPKSASMTFGSAVHFALEQLFKKMNQSEEKGFPDIAIFINDFKWYMRRNQDSFVEAEYKRRLEYGEEILSNYYKEYIGQWNKITSIEKSYRNVVVDGIPLNGKLDKMEFDGNYVNVVDYKTGSFKNAKSKFVRPNPEAVELAKASGKEPKFEEEHGGDYWRQAVFYKILMDKDATKKWEMKSSEFDFVEPIVEIGANGENTYHFHKEKINITQDDMALVTQQIKFVHGKIKNKEFNQGCGKEDCLWCTFTKDYYSANPEALKEISWPEIEENEESKI
ncbi:MAG: ATP-dependent helicase [Bacteroidia bacterium]|nr:ATP-dependent helicase [Bacteroidia bacterium]MCF8445616.1 ATP-dependent helicase [Bacteroidia bacterium]